ncbi:hypothetical protein IAF53_20360, partial [Acinetobacter baumannii]|nr:hypothetical protein [Acinetobacter baumannii]
EPQMLINFFHFIAEETREWLAALGVASLKDLIGRVDLLEVLPDVLPYPSCHSDEQSHPIHVHQLNGHSSRH